MKRFGSLASVAVVGILSSWPGLAQACAVCFGASGRSRAAFFDTTIFLSLLPLGMIGGGLWWLRRGALDNEFEDRDAYTPDVEIERKDGADPS